MVDIQKTIRLNNGTNIPQLGLGVWQIPNGQVVSVVRQALEIGYRLIDTAKVYGNEEGVGRGIAESGIARDEIFITTKLSVYDILRPQKAFEESLKRLQLDYVDLYLIHWPMIFWPSAWKVLEQIYQSGRAKAIGVSNFGIKNLTKLKSLSEIVPAVDQVELSPFLQRRNLVNYCRANGIAPEAYSPLTHGRRLNHPTIVVIGKAHEKSAAQVMIRWAIQHNLIVIPKARSWEHLEANFRVFDFELNPDEMKKLDDLEENYPTFPLWSRG